jgi:hypothetical protein
MTAAELDQAFLDPRVYTRAFRSYNESRANSAAALQGVIKGEFADYGTAISGDRSYGNRLFKNRCVALRDSMAAAGYTVDAQGTK